MQTYNFSNNYLTSSQTQRRNMKKTIPSQSGDYKVIVGKNPDIKISNGDIILKATGEVFG